MVTGASESGVRRSPSTGAGGLNGRQREYAENIAGGMAASAAYRAPGYTANGRSSESEASRMLRNPKVARYLTALREDMSRTSAATREDYRDLLTSIAWNPAELTRNRLRAGEQLARLCGWNEPEPAPEDTVQKKLNPLIVQVLDSAYGGRKGWDENDDYPEEDVAADESNPTSASPCRDAR